MRWYNADMDSLPLNGSEVLASVNGVYYLAIYDENIRAFRLKDQPEEYFAIGEQLIYWSGLLNQ
jgi:hypothetical protein